MSSSSNESPCVACTFLRRTCTKECVLAPCFPAEELQKFMDVERVYGVDYIERVLKAVEPSLRGCAADTLWFEARARIQNPVYGAVGLVLSLQQQISQNRRELAIYREKYGMLPPPTHKDKN